MGLEDVEGKTGSGSVSTSLTTFPYPSLKCFQKPSKIHHQKHQWRRMGRHCQKSARCNASACWTVRDSHQIEHTTVAGHATAGFGCWVRYPAMQVHIYMSTCTVRQGLAPLQCHHRAWMRQVKCGSHLCNDDYKDRQAAFS